LRYPDWIREFTMGLSKPELQDSSIVVAGAFNPAIVQPSWLARNALITPGEAENAEVGIIHSEVAKFRIGGWAQVEVIKTRFGVTTSQESSFESIRDLCLGILRLLAHSPVGAMGINRQTHFRTRSETHWHAYGDKFAPKEIWKDLPQFHSPGLTNLTMQSPRQDGRAGQININIQPSLRISCGIFFAMNDHYDLHQNSDASRAIEILEVCWEESQQRAEKMIDAFRSLSV
jgi:hypothetical protein